MINDQRTITLISIGDQKKFRQLMEYISDDLFIFAMGFVKSREVAEEIVSDVFVKIWKKRSALEQIKNLKSYLYIAVKNNCLSYLRKNKKITIISFDDIPEFHFPLVHNIDDKTIDKEMLKRVYSAIEQLPPKCQMAFSLAKINGMRYKEIAEVMNISEKTVNNHIVTAIHKISDTLGIKKKSKNK